MLLLGLSISVCINAQVRGQVKAAQQSLISSEIQAKIVSMPYGEGDYFEEGSLLVAFDCTLQLAEYDVAKADERSSLLQFENNQRLAKLNATSNLELELSEVEYEKAKAIARTQNAHVKRCKIVAPYAGTVSEKLGNEYEIASYTQELLRIVGNDVKDIELIVASDWVSGIEIGQQFNFSVEETAKSYPAKVSRIAPTVDTVSQTVKIYANFEGDAAQIIPGMSGTADLTPQQQ